MASFGVNCELQWLSKKADARIVLIIILVMRIWERGRLCWSKNEYKACKNLLIILLNLIISDTSDIVIMYMYSIFLPVLKYRLPG